MEYKTGDIVTARVKGISMLFHKGIVVKLNDGVVWFIHNSPNRKNEYGGNLLIDTPEDFYKTRSFSSVKHTDLTIDYIYDYYNSLKERKFDILLWNCEHFVYFTELGKKNLHN